MKHYSFVEESAVSNILALGGMTNLASGVGGMIGRHAGNTVSQFNTKELKSRDVDWTNPVFASIVKKSLVNSKEKIKLAKEWYDSCDKRDKYRAKKEYLDAINEYKSIQLDIMDRKADRWLGEYKKELAKINSEKFSKIGKIGAGTAAFIGTAARLMKAK